MSVYFVDTGVHWAYNEITLKMDNKEREVTIVKKMRILAIFLVLALVMTGCCLKHEWVEADCLTPKTCAKCEKTEGEALGHDWADATCTAPKTCGHCGETEGDALGHDWAEADCVNPKTCGRCGETEGEALGHSNSGWKATDADTMANTCTVCGFAEEKPMDREFIGRQQILGKWELTSITMREVWFDYAPGWTLEFFEDGTFEILLTDVASGEVVYVEFYDGDKMDFYVFDGNTAENSYSINYEPEEDVIYIIGSEFFKFTRVAE